MPPPVCSYEVEYEWSNCAYCRQNSVIKAVLAVLYPTIPMQDCAWFERTLGLVGVFTFASVAVPGLTT